MQGDVVGVGVVVVIAVVFIIRLGQMVAFKRHKRVDIGFKKAVDVGNNIKVVAALSKTFCN